MFDRTNARVIRPATGTDLTAKSWLTEAALRMLMNNLHPDVAENPEELVVYGGIGRAARTWEDLPQAARDYVEYVEKAIGCHIAYVSVGAERESIILR